MNQGKYVFAQLTEFLPQRVFDRIAYEMIAYLQPPPKALYNRIRAVNLFFRRLFRFNSFSKALL